MNFDRKEFIEKLMAGVHASMDKLILERMAINEPLVVGVNGKVKHVSPFVIAEERWGKEFVEQWKADNSKRPGPYSLYL